MTTVSPPEVDVAIPAKVRRTSWSEFTNAETDAVYQSNLFRMQVDELLKEVTLKAKAKTALDEFVAQLSSALLQMPATQEYEVADWFDSASKKLDRVCIPFVCRRPPRRGQLRCSPPVAVEVVGSYALGLVTRPSIAVDVAVEMPSSMFAKRDFMNQQYYCKRAIFLAALASHVKNLSFVGSLSFDTLHGNALKPILIVAPCGFLAKHYTVRILPVLPKDLFAPSRFLPSVSNVQSSWFFGSLEATASDDSAPQTLSTPMYNQMLLEDRSMLDIARDLKPTFCEKNVREATILLRVWLQQRKILSGQRGFTRFLLSVLMHHYFLVGSIKKHMNTYQILRCVFLLISDCSWNHSGLSLGSSAGLSDMQKEFQQHFPLVFLDSSGYTNFFASLSVQSLQMLRQEAARALNIINSRADDAFELLFMTPLSFVKIFDHTFRVRIAVDRVADLVEKMGLERLLVDLSGDARRTLLPSIVRVLTQGLQDRVTLLYCEDESLCSWKLTDKPLAGDAQKDLKFRFGIMLNASASITERIIDRGPAANSTEAAQFRQFWGEKSELRKFADGTLCEAVLWESTVAEDTTSVLEKIVKYLLEMYFAVPASDCHYASAPISQLLPVLPSCSNCRPKSINSYQLAHRHLQTTFVELTDALRSVKGLPLHVNAVTPIDTALRGTDVCHPVSFQSCPPKGTTYVRNQRFVPRPKAFVCPAWCKSVQVLFTLESSGKWPDDVDAVKRVKAAFHVKLAELLAQQYGYVTSAGAEHIHVMVSGLIFQLTLVYHREVTLLRQKTEDGLLKLVDTPESQALELLITHRPAHDAAVRSVAVQYASFGTACRLAKRWVATHMLSGFLSAEAIELLLCYVYLHPGAFAAPNSSLLGLLRFWHLLATFDWLMNPLIVNFNDTFSKEDIANVREQFQTIRASLPVFCLCTPHDRVGNRWTRPQPAPEIVDRLTSLASSALRVMEETTNSSIASAFLSSFRPSLEIYDALIYLNTKLIARRRYALSASPKRQASNPLAVEHCTENLPVLDYEPVDSYLKQLQTSYGEWALFFYDHLGGEVIGCVWKPAASRILDVKVSHFAAHMVVYAPMDGSSEQQPKLAVNKHAIVEHFRTLGMHLVRDVVVRKLT